jgi:hypothetical protein
LYVSSWPFTNVFHAGELDLVDMHETSEPPPSGAMKPYPRGTPGPPEALPQRPQSRVFAPPEHGAGNPATNRVARGGVFLWG